MRISFLVAGVQKGGTTAMDHNLRTHPDVGMPRRKETHFFDREGLDWSAPGYDKLHQLYRPGRSVYGEATPITIYWPPAHERIRAYNPDMRFIFLFRDPVERAFSQWCMEFARGRETLTFGEAIRRGRERVRQGQMSREHRIYSYVERGFYSAQIDAIRRLFPSANLLHLMSEELLENRAMVLTKVAKFIGVCPEGFKDEPIVARTRKPVNYPSSITDADRAYLRELFAADLELFAGLTGLDIGRWPTVKATAPAVDEAPKDNR
ncbi:MAG: sulfotransferase [Rhizomicrobium sp.]